MQFVQSWLALQFAGIWNLLWYFGTGGFVVIVALLVWLFQPAFIIKFFPRAGNISLVVAVAVAGWMVSSAIGVRLGEQHIQAKWDAAKANAVADAKKARAAAVRSVARKPSKWMPAHKDPYNRD